MTNTTHMTRILLAFLLISVNSFGQVTNNDSENAKALSDWNVLEHVNYTMSYPLSWELDESGTMGTSFFIYAPSVSKEDPFRENVNLLIQDLSAYNIDLNQFTEISEGQIKTMITNSTLIESKRIKDERGEYHKIIYSGDQGIFQLTFEQYYWVIDKKAYILTFTCEQDNYAEMAEIGERILNSFAFKN